MLELKGTHMDLLFGICAHEDVNARRHQEAFVHGVVGHVVPVFVGPNVAGHDQVRLVVNV